MLNLPNHIHILLKLLPPTRIRILQPLNRHHRTPIIQHRPIHRPQPAFPQHLRRRSQQILQLKPLLLIIKHKFITPITISTTTTTTIRVNSTLTTITTPTLPNLRPYLRTIRSSFSAVIRD
ncbi:hypothetical protein HanRHA438_Chr01g0042201 [Helianthus annuus]|nr:hypothetical protein HanRHA438_Chr01g0042201 [Helianthus annuus]